MTRFTKFTLTLAAIVAVAIVTAVLVGQAYSFRGHFAVGGEWLLPLVAVEVKCLFGEVKKVFKTIGKDF